MADEEFALPKTEVTNEAVAQAIEGFKSRDKSQSRQALKLLLFVIHRDNQYDARFREKGVFISICKQTKLSDPFLAQVMGALSNYTDRSVKLNDAMNEIVEVLMPTLSAIVKAGAKTYDNKVIDRTLTVLYNLSKSSAKSQLVKLVDPLMPLIKHTDESIRAASLLTLANLVQTDKAELLLADNGAIEYIMSEFTQAVEREGSEEPESDSGWHADELAMSLAQIGRNDSNKKRIAKYFAVPLLIRLAQSASVDSVVNATNALWTLAFDLHNRKQFDQDAITVLRQISQSTAADMNDSRRNAAGALWLIEGHNEKIADVPVIPRARQHVMLSYNWASQEIILAVKDALVKAGFPVWIDVDYMSNNILEAMAAAVEGSAVVCIGVSQKYKESPNCRTEAEYAYNLHKDMIPIFLSPEYKPDGWLGLLVGTRLFFDFSDSKRFEKNINALIKEIQKKFEDNLNLTAALPPTTTTTTTTIATPIRTTKQIKTQLDPDYSPPKSVDDVCLILEKIHLEQYVQVFRNERIDGVYWPRLTEEMLTVDLKITSPLHRMKIMVEVDKAVVVLSA